MPLPVVAGPGPAVSRAVDAGDPNHMPSSLRASISNWIRPTVGNTRYLLAELLDRANGRESMVPPRVLHQIGNGDFEAIGAEFTRHLTSLAALQPSSRVLDLGCGVGRIAIPLTRVLSPPGGYVGLDIVRNNIRWCSSRITPRHRHFQFLQADVFNRYYNPKGSVTARDYRLPLDAETFDIVFLVSVFTHMLEDEMQNYVTEAERVLKVGGRLFATFFLLNDGSRTAIRNRTSHLPFTDAGLGVAVLNPNVPEHAIAFDEDRVRNHLTRSGFRLREPIAYGSWSGPAQPLSFQDIVVAEKA